MKITKILCGMCLAASLFLFAASVNGQNASPLGGVGNLQFFANDGTPLTAGVVYIYQAGTSTQATVYVDATGTTTQPNPVTFGTGARASIWLANSTFVKVVLCLQNDGPFCAAGDILFSADQVPIGSSGTGGSSPFTGIFISSTASPATSGVLRLATGDSICFRNAAGSANLCFSKNSNDILSWAGGSLQLPEIGTPTCGAVGFDCLWADNTAHRLKAINNGGTAAQYVLSGNDVSTTDAVTSVHFGATQIPFGMTAPNIVNQTIQWNGTNLVPGGIVYATPSAATTASIGNTPMATAPASGALYRYSFYMTQTALGSACTGNSTLAMTLTYTDPGAAGSANNNFQGQTITTNGTVGQMIGFTSNPQDFQVVRVKGSAAISYFTTLTPGTNCAPAPQYQVYPVLEQLTVN